MFSLKRWQRPADPVDEWLYATPIAHRGLHSESIPENSLPSIAAAAKAGYITELDVQLTGDGVPVIVHDPHLERLAGVAAEVGSLSAEEVSRLRLGGSDHHIPTLVEGMEVLQGSPGVLVEIKPWGDWRALLRATVQALTQARTPVAFQSFHPLVVKWLRTNQDFAPVGQIGGRLRGIPLAPARKAATLVMPLNAYTRPDFYSVDVEGARSVAFRGWNAVQRRPTLIWTITSEQEHAEARRFGRNVIFEGFRPRPSRQASSSCGAVEMPRTV